MTSREIIVWIFITIVFVGLLIQAFLLEDGQVSGNEWEALESPKIVQRKDGKYVEESCQIAYGKPLDTSLLKIINESAKFTCKPKYELETSLKDGVLDIRESAYEELGQWSFRCIQPINKDSIIGKEWIPIVRPKGTEVACDIVEIKAVKYGARTYGYLHAQVVRRKYPKLSATKVPSVHVIVLDTISTPNFIRSMKKTHQLLLTDYKGVLFPYLNKVAMSSTLNAMTMFFGLQAHNIEETVWGSAKPRSRKRREFILSRFHKQGYRTLLGEDHGFSFACSGQCGGTDTPPDHWLTAYGRRLNFYNPNETDLFYFDRTNSPEEFRDHMTGYCVRPHTTLLGTLDSFVNHYSEEAQFSLNWLSILAHEDLNALYEVDEEFYSFFKKNKEKLENSFVFIMGDHGPRHGEVRDFLSGRHEDYNPLLFMTVPKHLRSDVAYESAVHENSKQLVSHHDVHATFVDILERFIPPNPSSESQGPSHEPPLGSSLLKPLPQPRNCNSLRIPLSYCMCKIVINTEHNSPMGKRVAQLAVDMMNEHFIKYNLTNDCVRLSLNEKSEIDLEEYNVRGLKGEKMVHVMFSVFPDNIKFIVEAYIDHTANSIRIISNKFQRVSRMRKEELEFGLHTTVKNRREFCYFKAVAKALKIL